MKYMEFQGEGNYTVTQDLVYMIKLTDELLDPIKEEVNKIKKDFSAYDSLDARDKLAGNLSKEFDIVDTRDHIEREIVIPASSLWASTTGIINEFNPNSEFTKFKMTGCWVNFQQKHEFNPFHDHSGVFSWVLWLDIPYNIEDEVARHASVKSNSPSPGCFQFIYPTFSGCASATIPVDKKYNGVLAVFRSSTKHLVNPFYTSDDYRVTLAGNVCFDTGGNND